MQIESENLNATSGGRCTLASFLLVVCLGATNLVAWRLTNFELNANICEPIMWELLSQPSTKMWGDPQLTDVVCAVHSQLPVWSVRGVMLKQSNFSNFSMYLVRMFLSNFWFLFLSVIHCRCSKCYSVPVRKRVRKRTPALTLLSLPEEVLLCVLQCLSAEDLLAVRAVSKDTQTL